MKLPLSTFRKSSRRAEGRFISLVHHRAEEMWRSCNFDTEDYWGSTPEEAVAKLWLALHNKANK